MHSYFIQKYSLYRVRLKLLQKGLQVKFFLGPVWDLCNSNDILTIIFNFDRIEVSDFFLFTFVKRCVGPTCNSFWSWTIHIFALKKNYFSYLWMFTSACFSSYFISYLHKVPIWHRRKNSAIIVHVMHFFGDKKKTVN